MKRIVFLLLLLCISSALGAHSYFQCTVEPLPNQLKLSWDTVAGADHYDIYLDTEANQRVRGKSVATIGSNDEPLYSHRQYEVMVVARKADDTIVSIATAQGRTTGWEGEYYWKNETKKDNKGQVKELLFRITFDGTDYRAEAFYDRWHTIYPAVPPELVGQFFDYVADGKLEESYRAFAQTFNTTTIRPTRWRITSLGREAARLIIEAESYVRGISATTRTEFYFVVSAKEEPELHFTTSAKGIAGMWIFHSPNPGDKGVFKAVSR